MESIDKIKSEATDFYNEYNKKLDNKETFEKELGKLQEKHGDKKA